MALRPCLTCEAMISTSARKCPQCGEPSPHATETQKRVAIIVMVVLVLGMIGFGIYKSEQVSAEHEEFGRRHGMPRSTR